MQTKQVKNELLTVVFSKPMPYEWSVGEYGSLFFHGIREHQRFTGIRCRQCGKVYVPPRRLCGPCYKELDELVLLPNTGTITAFSVVNYPFIDPATGEHRPVPYTYGSIRIDGADCIFSHIINETDPHKLQIGMRVRPVFKNPEEMEGNIQDIKYFELISVTSQ
ncbi:MAG: Zn-ribbon domain-containing OB-fold protein [Pseudomonadota bacterium]